MSSLYEMIYGSQEGGGVEAAGDGGNAAAAPAALASASTSQATANTGSSGSRKKRRRATSPSEKDEYAYDAVDAFYDAPSQSSAASPRRESQSSSPFLGQLSQQSYASDSSQQQGLMVFDSDDEDNVSTSSGGNTSGASARATRRRNRRKSSLLTATSDQIEKKRQRTIRRDRRRRFRHTKKWDLTEERDYGGAVECMIRRLMEERNSNPSKQAKGRKKKGSSRHVLPEFEARRRARELAAATLKIGDEADDEGDNGAEEDEVSSESDESGEETEEKRMKQRAQGVLDALERLSQSQEDDPLSQSQSRLSQQSPNRSSESGGYSSSSNQSSAPEDSDNMDDDNPLSYLRKGHSAPRKGWGSVDNLEYSYTRDSSHSSGSAPLLAVPRSLLPLHGQNPSVKRLGRKRSTFDAFAVFPNMSRHGPLSGRVGMDDARRYASGKGFGLTTTYLPPREVVQPSSAATGRPSGRYYKKLDPKRKRPPPPIKLSVEAKIPSAKKVHLDQLRRLAACLVTGASTGPLLDHLEEEKQHRRTVFRMIEVLHSVVHENPKIDQMVTRDKIVLAYGREVESNRELWRQVRYEIRERLRCLERESEDGSNDDKMRELHEFCDLVVDVMDELNSDEPCWMCGPNATWDGNLFRTRAGMVRRRVEALFPAAERATKSADDEDKIDKDEANEDGGTAASDATAAVATAVAATAGSSASKSRKVRFNVGDGDENDEDNNKSSSEGSNNDDSDAHQEQSLAMSSSQQAGIRKDKDSEAKADKYAVMLHNSRLDPCMVVITVAALVSELCTARARTAHKAANEEDKVSDNGSDSDHGYQQFSAMSGLNDNDAEDEILDLKHAVLNYFDLVIKSFPLYHQWKHLPLPALAAAAMSRQSFVANDLSFWFESERNRENNSFVGGIDINLGGGEDENNGVDMGLVGEDLANMGRKLLADPRLNVFPELHITSVLASIAVVLPSKAAEIISRPLCLDDPSRRTPFDLVRSALEDMESQEQISYFEEEGGFSALAHQNDTITASKLVSELVTAAEFAGEVAEKDPDDPLYASWHLSLLAGATCVSSGIIIGKGAQRAASDYYDDVGGERRRVRLNNHAEIRLLTANALRKLLERTSSSQPKAFEYHVTISSFMEWKEVVCLLMSRGINDLDYFARTRTLHAYHTIRWAMVEKSDSALLRIAELLLGTEVNADVLLSLLADRLEQEPEDDHRWMHLASALGPLGETKSSLLDADDDSVNSCSVEGCKECPRLHCNVNLDHGEAHRRREAKGWWGEGRSDFWERQYFHSFSVSTSRTGATARRSLDVGIALHNLTMQGNNHDSAEIQLYSGRTRGLGPTQHPDMNPIWLASSEGETDFYFSSDEEDNSDDEVDPNVLAKKYAFSSGRDGTRTTTTIKRKMYDQFLPKHVTDTNRRGISSYLAEMSQHCEPMLHQSSSRPELRQSLNLCCKVLVACHLFGMDHAFVTNAVFDLARECPQTNAFGQPPSPDQSSCEFLLLLWLSKLGLNVHQIISDALANGNGNVIDDNDEMEVSSQPYRYATSGAAYAFAPIDL